MSLTPPHVNNPLPNIVVSWTRGGGEVVTATPRVTDWFRVWAGWLTDPFPSGGRQNKHFRVGDRLCPGTHPQAQEVAQAMAKRPTSLGVLVGWKAVTGPALGAAEVCCPDI